MIINEDDGVDIFYYHDDNVVDKIANIIYHNEHVHNNHNNNSNCDWGVTIIFCDHKEIIILIIIKMVIISIIAIIILKMIPIVIVAVIVIFVVS